MKDLLEYKRAGMVSGREVYGHQGFMSRKDMGGQLKKMGLD
jgi:hypothetical protein